MRRGLLMFLITGAALAASAGHATGQTPSCPGSQEFSGGTGGSTPSPGLITLRCSGASPTYSIVTNPARGVISNFDAAAGTLNYTALPGTPPGTDSFTYQASNPMGTSDVSKATVLIGVNPADFGSVTTTPQTPPPKPKRKCKKPQKKGKGAGASAKKKCGKTVKKK